MHVSDTFCIHFLLSYLSLWRRGNAALVPSVQGNTKRCDSGSDIDTVLASLR